jgi:hypothetical protein
MSGKRKADDMSTAGPEEKLSKKAKLKLARERAAQFAQRDKEKIESRRAEKYGGTNVGAQSKSSENSPSPKKKLTLTERKKIAMENAKEFAARDKAGLEAARSPAKKQKISQPKTAPQLTAAATEPSPMEVVEDIQLPSPKQNFGAAIDPNQVAEYEKMRQTQQLQTAGDAQRELLGNAPMKINQSILLPDTTNADGGVGDMNEEDMPPPPPALMAQVSQQVLLNAQIEDASYAKPVVTLVENQTISIEASDTSHPEPIGENDKSLQAAKTKSRWLPKIALLIIVGIAISSVIDMEPTSLEVDTNALISSMIVMIHASIEVGTNLLNASIEVGTSLVKTYSASLIAMTKEDDASDNMSIQSEPVCFFDSDSEYDEGCYGSVGLPCPKGGRCQGGKLFTCDNIYQDVSDDGDKCVLSESYLEMKTGLIDMLVSHSSQICDQTSKPKFKYDVLQKELPSILVDESEDLVEALKDEGFVVNEREGLLVGLPDDFEVSLPIYCHLGNIGQKVLQEVGLLLLFVLRIASTNLLGFVSTYPKPSAILSFLLVVFLKIRKYFAAKKKRQEDIIRTRDIAYRTLEESNGVEHCALHIRDEIAMALYPNSRKLRTELQKYAWPRVVDDVKRDTRIRKFQSLNKDGKTRDMWQWTAASKPSSQS